MKERTSKLTGFATLLLFTVMAACMLLVLLTGAKIYRNLVQNGRKQFEDQTAVQYVITRVRQAKTVEIGEFDGCEALIIPEQIGGDNYLTRIYLHEGYLRELFCAADAALCAEDGQKLIPAEVLRFSQEEELLHVWVNSRQVLLHLPDREELP